MGNHIVATRTISVWKLLSAGTARLTQVLVLDDGPALAGTLRLRELIPGMVQTTVHEFTWSTPTVTAAYPCDLLVTTTGGTRLLRFAPPPPFTREDADKLVAVLLAKVASCELLVGGWFHGHGYNPHWSVDPPPGEAIVEHLWQVEVVGLDAGERATPMNSVGPEIAHATARTGRALRLSALLSPAGEQELTILRGASGSNRQPVGDETQQVVAGASLRAEEASVEHQGWGSRRGLLDRTLQAGRDQCR